MVILRSIVFSIVLGLLTLIFSVWSLLVIPLPRLLRYRAITLWNHCVMAALKGICGMNVRILGRSNLPTQPYLIVSKHQSAWEAIAYPCFFPPTSFVTKIELLWLPFFGWGMAAMSPIVIARSGGHAALRKVLTIGLKRLRQGMCVCLFPEGTRVEPGHTKKFFSSGFALAKQAGVPIVPIALNSGLFWPRSTWIKQPGTVTVSIGPSVQATGSARSLAVATQEWISAETKRLGG